MLPAKVRKETDAERRFTGRLFDTREPVTAQLRVLSTVLVLGTTRHLLSADRRCRLPTTVVTGTDVMSHVMMGHVGHLSVSQTDEDTI